jgi:hypothetical protein
VASKRPSKSRTTRTGSNRGDQQLDIIARARLHDGAADDHIAHAADKAIERGIDDHIAHALAFGPCPRHR